MSERDDLLHKVLGNLFDELVTGPRGDMAFMLNPGDAGLLAALEKLSAAQASAAPPNGGASVAAHADHLRYGLNLLNRWSQGEHPFGGTDFAASWERGVVTEQEWQTRLGELRREADAWRTALRTPREMSEIEFSGYIGSIAHLAYHMGAIRQIDRSMRGPSAKA